jgi:RimJ/RimL family protein N-acetyltransferase
VDEQPEYVVEGARVALGPLRMDLVATYQRWENDLEAATANGVVIPYTLEAQREYFAGRSGKPDFCDFTIYDRADQAAIGWSTLFRIDHRNGSADFGINLGERRDRGLGTEATRLTLDWGFTMLGLHNIMLGVAAWNHRAIRVYTKVGFREIGRRRSAGVTMGRRYDAVFMDLLASEFLQAGESVLAERAPHGRGSAERAGNAALGVSEAQSKITSPASESEQIH